MFRIKRFSHFRINEVDTSDTYLDKNKNIKVDPTFRKEPTEIFKMKGKIFKDAPKTSGKSYGLKFTKDGAGYNVVFPDNFFEHFLSDSKPIELDYTEEEYDFNKNQFISKKYRSSVAELLKDRVYIQTEKKYNRIHFSGGIPEQLQQIGLGYIIYEEFIKFLGVASSDKSSSSPDAKTVWQKVAQDPDFYCIITENKNANSRILAVYKDHPINSNSQKNKLGLIIEDFLRNETIQQQGQGAILKVDDYLIEKFPNLKIWQEHFKQGFTKQDWQNEITEVVNKLVELKDKKSLSGNVFQSINTKMYWFESFYSINKITEQETKIYTQLYNKLLVNCFQKKPGQSSNEFSSQNYEPLSFTITHEMASDRVIRALNFILVIQPLRDSNKEQVSLNQEIQLFPLS